MYTSTLEFTLRHDLKRWTEESVKTITAVKRCWTTVAEEDDTGRFWTVVFAFPPGTPIYRYESFGTMLELEFYVYSKALQAAYMRGKKYTYMFFAFGDPCDGKEKKWWLRCMRLARERKASLFSGEAFFRHDRDRFVRLAQQAFGASASLREDKKPKQLSQLTPLKHRG